VILQSGNVKVAILAFAEREFSIAGTHSPGAAPLDVIENVRQIEEAKSLGHIVIITVHGGNEYFRYPRPGLRRVCRFYIDLGVHAVICHHPHVAGAFEIYKERPIFYSLGNLIFDHTKPPPGWNDGYAVKLTFAASNRRVQVISQEIIPYEQSFPAIVKSYSTGWAALDAHMMICPPELIIVTGTPGHGKTQWVTALGANMARVHGLRGAILQFEDRPSRNHRDLLRYARAWMHAADGGVTIGTDDPHQWVEDMFLTISPTEDDDEDISLDLAWVKGAIEEAAKRHSCKWVTIDPFNEIEHLWGVRENETQYLNGALRDLKRLARRLQIALIIVTHPTKLGGEKSNIDDLTLYDVAGSAAWKNKADHGIIIHRNSPADPITTVKIDKARDNEMMGIPGKAQFEFDPQRALFTHVRR